MSDATSDDTRRFALGESLAAAREAGEVIDIDAYAARHGLAADDVRDAVAALEALQGCQPPAAESGGAEASASPLSDLALPGLTLIAELGRGGMGIVWRARQDELQRDVAVKVLAPGALTFDGALKRFRREAQSLASLRHRHIVAIHEVGRHAGLDYFVMDLVEGRSLAALLRAEGPLNPARATRLVRQVAGAIAYVHERGIVHRDLKPANVLIDTKGDAYVVDFGLAREADVDTSVTATGHLVGTPLYMAPEQVRGGPGAASEGVDVYALGGILYECLAGRAPFAELPFGRLVPAILNDDPPPLQRLARGVPDPLTWVARRALAKDPRERYSTARAFLEDLERYESGRAVVAAEPRFVDDLRRVLRRERTAARAVLTTIVALALVFYVFVAPRLSGDERVLALAEAALEAHDSERAVGLLRGLGEDRLDSLSGELLAAALLAQVDAAAEMTSEARRDGLADVTARAVRAGPDTGWALARGDWGGIEGRALAFAAIHLADHLARPLDTERRGSTVSFTRGLEADLVLSRLVRWTEGADVELAGRAGAVLLALLGSGNVDGSDTLVRDPERTQRALVRALDLQAGQVVRVAPNIGHARAPARVFDALSTTSLARNLARFTEAPQRMLARDLACLVGDVPLPESWWVVDETVDAAARAYDVETADLGAAARFERAVRFALDVLGPIDDRRIMAGAPLTGPCREVLSAWFGYQPDFDAFRSDLATTSPARWLAKRLRLDEDPARWDARALALRLRDGPHEDARAVHAALAYCLPAWDRGVPWSWERPEPPPASWEQVLGPSTSGASLAVQWALVSEKRGEVIAQGAAAVEDDSEVRFDVPVPLLPSLPSIAARSGRHRRPSGLDGAPLDIPLAGGGGLTSVSLQLAGAVRPERLGPCLSWRVVQRAIPEAPLWVRGGVVHMNEPLAVGTVHLVCVCGDERTTQDERDDLHLIARLAPRDSAAPVDLGAWRSEIRVSWDAVRSRAVEFDNTHRLGRGLPRALTAQRDALAGLGWLAPDRGRDGGLPRDGFVGVEGPTGSVMPPLSAPRTPRAANIVEALAIGFPLVVVLVVLAACAQAWAYIRGWRDALRRAGIVLFVGLATLGCDRFGAPSLFVALLGVGALGVSLARHGAAARLPAALILAGAALEAIWAPSGDVRADALARSGAAALAQLGAVCSVPLLAAALRRSPRYRMTLEALLWGIAAVVLGGPASGSLGATLAWLPHPSLADVGQELVREVRAWRLLDVLDGSLARCGLLAMWLLSIRFGAPVLGGSERRERSRSLPLPVLVTPPRSEAKLE